MVIEMQNINFIFRGCCTLKIQKNDRYINVLIPPKTLGPFIYFFFYSLFKIFCNFTFKTRLLEFHNRILYWVLFPKKAKLLKQIDFILLCNNQKLKGLFLECYVICYAAEQTPSKMFVFF